MNGSTLRNLGIVLFALIAILVGLELSDDTADVATGEPLFPDLRDRINDVERLAIDRPDTEEVVITRRDDGWTVENRGGYPADVGRVRELLLALADAKVLEEKTSNPDLYPALGVSDPDVEDSEGVLLTVTAGPVDYALVIGNANPGSGRYVRPAGEAASLLIDTDPDLPDDAGGWLRTDLMDIETADVASVTIEHTDGEKIVISKVAREDANFAVADIPEGRTLSYATVANGIGGALNDLELDDVRPAEGGEFEVVTTVRTFDGLDIRVTAFAGADDNRWFAFEASYDAAATNAGSAEDAGEGAETVDVPALVAGIDARTGGWQFRLPSYKANLLTRRWEDILAAEDSDEGAE